MRELLYVSDAKLKNFVDEGRSMRLPKMSGEAEVSVLEALKLKFSIAGSDGYSDAATLREVLKRIDRVLKHLDNSEDPPLWFEDQKADVGDWVQFEGRFAYAALQGAVLAWQFDQHSETADRGVSLLLHGSAKHMVGKSGRDLDELAPAPSRWHRVRRLLPRLLEEISDGSFTATERSAGLDVLLMEAKYVLRQAAQYSDGAKMAGFARVTHVHKRTGQQIEHVDIYASPLYIELI